MTFRWVESYVTALCLGKLLVSFSVDWLGFEGFLHSAVMDTGDL